VEPIIVPLLIVTPSYITLPCLCLISHCLACVIYHIALPVELIVVQLLVITLSNITFWVYPEYYVLDKCDSGWTGTVWGVDVIGARLCLRGSDIRELREW
jgi:hypothetical protein